MTCLFHDPAVDLRHSIKDNSATVCLDLTLSVLSPICLRLCLCQLSNTEKLIWKIAKYFIYFLCDSAI